jgi:hypothetical protein
VTLLSDGINGLRNESEIPNPQKFKRFERSKQGIEITSSACFWQRIRLSPSGFFGILPKADFRLKINDLSHFFNLES